MRCKGSILGVRFNMRATVLNMFASDPAKPDVGIGHWEVVQDDDTGGVKRIWVDGPVSTPAGYRRADFQSNKLGPAKYTIECAVRGFTEVGFRSSANTESFLDGSYRPFEVVEMTYPAKYTLSRRQLVTDIGTKGGKPLWVEADTGNPTVFEVQGVTPTFDPFGKHIDNLTVLRRSDVQ